MKTIGKDRFFATVGQMDVVPLQDGMEIAVGSCSRGKFGGEIQSRREISSPHCKKE